MRQVVATVLLLLTIAVPASLHAQDAVRDWTVVDVVGLARLQPVTAGDHAARPLQQGDAVTDGQTVATAPNARLTLVRGDDVIVVYGDSVVTLPRQEGGITRILQRFGRALFRVGKRSSGAFEVETPLLIAGVKGTEFAVSVSGAGGNVTVLEGLVETRVARSSAVALVEAGESVDVASPIQPSMSPHETPAEARAFWQDRSRDVPAAAPNERREAEPATRPIRSQPGLERVPARQAVEPVVVERPARERPIIGRTLESLDMDADGAHDADDVATPDREPAEASPGVAEDKGPAGVGDVGDGVGAFADSGSNDDGGVTPASEDGAVAKTLNALETVKDNMDAISRNLTGL